MKKIIFRIDNAEDNELEKWAKIYKEKNVIFISKNNPQIIQIDTETGEYIEI